MPDAVESDEPAPFAAPGARRVVSRGRAPARVAWSPPRKARAACPRRRARASDLLYVPGEREQLRIGYRVPEDAPDELRALLARMLDSVEIRRHA